MVESRSKSGVMISPSRSNVKSVLIITQCWPPDASVGSLRPLHLARKLAERGRHPIILTLKERHYQHVNQSQECEIQGTVIRTTCLPHPRKAYLWVKQKVAKILGQEASLTETIKFEFRDRRVQSPSGFFAKTKRQLLSLLLIPDFWQGWIPPAIFAGLQAIKHHKVQIIISTGPPFSAHLIALALKKLRKVTWIADFRDPWSFNEQQLFATPLSDDLNRRLEKLVVCHCDRIVTVSSAITAKYQTLYRASVAKKCRTISNGFDDREFIALRDVQQYPKFTISYLGHFSYVRTPDMLLNVLEKMLNDKDLTPDMLSVRFIGLCRYSEGRLVQDILRKKGLETIVEIIDPIPRQEALLEMAKSHLLLLLANDQVTQIPAKTYEYIGVGRPILAITEEKGATAELVNCLPGCSVVDPKDEAHLRRVLLSWLDLHARGNQRMYSDTDESVLRQYKWESLAEKYVSLLEECEECIESLPKGGQGQSR